MIVRFGLEFDGMRPVDEETRLGFVVAGPATFLSILETQLGIISDSVSEGERIVQYRACLDDADRPERFYQRSFAVDELGDDFVDHLYQLAIESTDAVVRGRTLEAIGSTKNPLKAAEIRELVFSSELRDNEIYSILFPQMLMPETRDATWLWFQKNMDRILPRIPEERWGRMTFVGSAFCNTKKQAEVQAFFATRIEALTGGPRNLEQTLETIDLCVAKVKEHKTEMDVWLGQ